MKAKQADLTVVIILPAYNEAETIGSVLDGIPATMSVSGQTYKILAVVVNDGSTDKTADIVLKNKNAYLINHLLNSGAGAATRTGLAYAKQVGCVAAVTMDSDGQHDIKDTLKVAQAIIQDQGDLIIGSRLVDSEGMPWYRVLGNKGLSLLTFFLFGVFVSDSQSGLRGLNNEALDKITFSSDNFAFCSEMIWRAKQKKLRVKEVPIRAIYTDYSLSKGQSNWGVVHIVQQLLKHRFMEFLNG
jgi:glycosyltransferase involved in cell wall biosynthesis